MRKSYLLTFFTFMLVLTFVVASAFTGGVGQCAPKGGEVLFYSAMIDYPMSRLMTAFEEDTGIKGSWVTMSTGEMIARALAEKKNPQADIIIGLASEAIESVREEGIFLAYRSPVRKDIPAEYYDEEGVWCAFSLAALSIGINTERWESKYGDKPYPSKWEDLVDPAFKGEIVIPSPLHSGTAYTFLATIFFAIGEEKGWEYLTKLDKNVAYYTTSGAAPIRAVASGEFTLGLTFSQDQLMVAAAGYPIKIAFPKKTGPEITSMAIIRDGPNPDGAKKFVDWMLGKKAQQMHSDLQFQPSPRSDVILPPGAIPLAELDLVEYDFIWAAENRDRIIEEWSQRFVN